MEKQRIKKKITTEWKYATKKGPTRRRRRGMKEGIKTEIHKEEEKEGELYPEELGLMGCF